MTRKPQPTAGKLRDGDIDLAISYLRDQLQTPTLQRVIEWMSHEEFKRVSRLKNTRPIAVYGAKK